MSSSSEALARDPLDELVEQFVRRQRAGEAMDVEAFAAQHPDHASELRELLPTLLALEQVKRDRESTGSRSRVAVPALQRLGDFRIVRELGRGGMGVVFEAVQESLGRRVALKVLPQASLLTGSQLERFRREAQIAAQLHHSNIVPVYGSGESDGYHWYAMQFIAGESLDRWRQTQAAAAPVGSGAWRNRARFVARLGVQAASALHHAHSQGTLHRDIKPGNLLLENNDHLWITDFGLAKALEAEGLTHSGDLLGTLQYMAPEQFNGIYDARSEVYALGITLYELLLLRPAFAAKSRSELMERIRTQPPEALRRLCPDLPEDLTVVVERAMARDPRDRYRDAEALAQDLQAFLDDRPIAARRHGRLGLVVRWGRRNRALAALAASTLLAFVGAAVTGWVAYVTTADALGKEKVAAAEAARQSRRAESNLDKSLAAFGDVFDALVGRDPALALEEDPDTGEQTVIARPVVEPQDIELLQKMLRFYADFATENAESQSLRFQTARAHRRVGAIHARLGTPENLEAAAKAYEQAIVLYRDVSDRDVTRELAMVHVDQGQLEQRRGRLAEASQRYHLALQLLDNEQLGDSKAVRFERAQAHFLLARIGPGGGRGRPPGGAADDRSREPDRVRREPRQDLLAARSILATLLAEEPQNPEFLFLEARCRLRAGAPSRQPGGGAADAERAADRQAGLQGLRDLVQKYPDADQYRFELCDALVAELRPRGLRGPRSGGQRPPSVPSDEDLAALREAKGHAEKLLRLQKDFAEYQAQRARIASMLGGALLRKSRQPNATEAQRQELRAEAETELRAALQFEQALFAAVPAAIAETRFLLPSIATRLAFADLLLDSGRDEPARAEVRAIAEALRRLARAPGADREGPVEGRLPEAVESVFRRAGLGDLLPELSRELQELRDRAGPPDRGNQPGPRRR